MTPEIFIALLCGFASLTGIVVEAIKKIVNKNISFNLVAVIAGIVCGTAGTCVYYVLSDIAFTTCNIICAVLMGIASALAAMVGYDKIKQLVEQFIIKK